MHGWGRNAGRLIPYIKNLQDNGFNLLAFDTRHHGNSDHDKFSSMVKFAQDISASIDFIEADPITEKDNVFLIGLSIGGAASIYAAAADSRIKNNYHWCPFKPCRCYDNAHTQKAHSQTNNMARF